MAPLIAQLFASGMSLLGDALLKRGKEEVERRLGVTLPDTRSPASPEQLVMLRQLEMDHEKHLLELAVREKELELDAEKAQAAAVSGRWESDMGSDSWLSKNIRPLVLAYLTGIISVMAFASEWLTVQNAWVELLGTAYVTTIVAYFGSRGVEKVTTFRRSEK